MTVHTSAFLLALLTGLILTSAGADAAPMNKCIVNGTVTYQQGACPSDQVRKQPSLEELNAEASRRRAATGAVAAGGAMPLDKATPAAPAKAGAYRCDGRQHCSQMSSCSEAKYFLAHCPGVQMDGDGDGVPCESQWCGH